MGSLQVENGFFSKAMSSKTRLRILDLLSKRPRTLRELAGSTGISVQGVLRHLEVLNRLGLIEETRINSKELTARKLYHLRDAHFNDFSVGDIIIVRAAKMHHQGPRAMLTVEDMEDLAGDLLIRRRRIKEKAKRLARMIGELTEDEIRLVESIEGMNLSDKESLILETAFTEETLQDAEHVLSKVQGLVNARTSIDRALSKARRIAKK